MAMHAFRCVFDRCIVVSNSSNEIVCFLSQEITLCTLVTCECMQDVTRLLMFVATAEFSEIEQTAPGIVAAASDLLLEVLIAGTQPPSELARDDHSAQWRDMRDSVAANTARNPTRSRKKRKQR